MRYVVVVLLLVATTSWAKPKGPAPWKRDGGVTEHDDEWENCPRDSGLPPWRKCPKKKPTPAPAK